MTYEPRYPVHRRERLRSWLRRRLEYYASIVLGSVLEEVLLDVVLEACDEQVSRLTPRGEKGDDDER